MMEELCNVDDVPEGGSYVVDIGEKQIALFKIDGTIYGINASCPHRQGPLDQGDLNGKIVTCPLHRWSFDVTNGKSQFPPGQQVQCFNIVIEGDQVCLENG